MMRDGIGDRMKLYDEKDESLRSRPYSNVVGVYFFGEDPEFLER